MKMQPKKLLRSQLHLKFKNVCINGPDPDVVMPNYRNKLTQKNEYSCIKIASCESQHGQTAGMT